MKYGKKITKSGHVDFFTAINTFISIALLDFFTDGNTGFPALSYSSSSEIPIPFHLPEA